MNLSIIFAALFLILLVPGAIVLQIFLSRMESKWPGLILPGISLIISLFAVLSVAVFTTQGAVSQTVGPDGQVLIQQTVQQISGQSVLSTVSLVAVVFALYNIPTAVLLAIYGGMRGKRKRNLAVQKMSVQDLE